MLLMEENFSGLQNVCENAQSGDGKKFFLNGVFAEAEKKNRNGRIYKLSEMTREVQRVNEAAASGRHVLGELDHPDTLDVKLANVSHKILELNMVGNQAIGKAEILENHPNGQIVIGLMKDGVQLGVSTRGSGKVNTRTKVVEGFNMVTVDVVATPSAQNAYPETLREQLELYKDGAIIQEAAAGMIEKDPIAQKYFQMELSKFIRDIGLK